MGKQITDEKLLELLLVHGGVSGAAAACGLSKNAVYKRLQDDTFRTRYDCLQSVLLDVTAGNLADALGDAVKALRDVISDPEAAAGIKVSAAEALLRHTLRYIETANILTRLDRLERGTLL